MTGSLRFALSRSPALAGSPMVMGALVQGTGAVLVPAPGTLPNGGLLGGIEPGLPRFIRNLRMKKSLGF